MATKYKLLDGVKVEMTDAEKTESFLTTEQLAKESLIQLRIIRNELLSATDYMGNSDVTMSDAWKAYRKALRDITDTYGSMSDDGFSFPTKPS